MIVTFVTLILGILVIWFLWDQAKARNRPPGPFRWPIIGNLVDVHNAHPKYAYEAFDKLSKKYGGVMRLVLGMKDITIITSYKDMKDLLARDELSGRMCTDNFLDRTLGQERGVVFTSGDHWNVIRKFTVRNLRDFGFGKKSTMESMLQEEVEDVIKNLQAEAEVNNGNVLLRRNYFSRSLLNIIFSMLAGVRFENGDPKLEQLVTINNKGMQSGSFGAGLILAFPFLRHIFPKSTGFAIQQEATADFVAYFKDLLIKHRSREGFQDDPQSFADVFLAQIEMSCGSNATYFTEEEFCVLYMDMFQVGAETANGSISFALLYMILNPDKQDRLRKEVDSVIGTRLPTLTDKTQMPYTMAFIWEVLRIGNIVPVIPTRKAMADVHYKGYVIPKDSPITGNLYSILFDQDYWGDPLIFRPDRFLKTDAAGNLKFIQDERLSFAFGVGKRSCLGDQLALGALFLFTVTLVQNVTFEAVKGKPLPSTAPELGFTLAPGPFDMVVKTRNT